MGENRADLELLSIANGMGTAAVHGEHTTLSCTLHIQQLLFDEGSYGDSPLHVSVCALPHQLFMHFSIFHSLLQKGKQFCSP
jgi:hypothetical protein